MLGFNIAAAVGVLWLAGACSPAFAASASAIQCTVPKAPQIKVLTDTASITYDYRQTAAQLSQLQSSTVNPYAPNVDTTTGGLREDQPKISLEMSWGTMTYPRQQAVCFWYDTITVKIALSPRIFVAKDLAQEPCKSAIIEHELKHVAVDRDVMNKYAADVGKAVQKAVNDAGAMGPYNIHEIEETKTILSSHIEGAMKSHELALHKEMRSKQAQVDTLEEYERVGKICRSIQKKK